MRKPPASEDQGPVNDRSRLANRVRLESRFEFWLWLARGFVLLPVVVLVFASLGAFVYGAVEFVRYGRQVFFHAQSAQHVIGDFLLVIDLFLIGATMLIAAIGLYELFISKVNPRGLSQLPMWLQMHDLNDLKARVIAMIVLVAGVMFVDVLVNMENGWKTLRAGAGISLMIVALTVFLHFGASSGSGANRS